MVKDFPTTVKWEKLTDIKYGDLASKCIPVSIILTGYHLTGWSSLLLFHTIIMATMDVFEVEFCGAWSTSHHFICKNGLLS